MPNGLLLLNKPAGVRSTVCVAIAKRRFNREFKVGHGGTLDSTAEGLLVLLVGNATRVSDLVMDLPKLYETFFLLGEERSTDDYSGDLLFRGTPPLNARPLIEKILPSFYGVRRQTPPGISAVRVEGQRAHAIVRSGREVALACRQVAIRSLALLPSPEGERNVFALRVSCSKGTYIRSLVRDIGRKVGCGAHVLRLIRRETGSLSLQDAISFEEFRDGTEDLSRRMLPLSRFAGNFYSFEADGEHAELLKNGRTVPLSSLRFLSPGIQSPLRGVAVTGKNLFSHGQILREGLYKPRINILLEGTE